MRRSLPTWWIPQQELVAEMRFCPQVKNPRGRLLTGQAVENAKEGGAIDDAIANRSGADRAASGSAPPGSVWGISPNQRARNSPQGTEARADPHGD